NVLVCRSGGIGRHAILRGWCLTRRGGSNPPFGIGSGPRTKHISDVQIPHKPTLVGFLLGLLHTNTCRSSGLCLSRSRWSMPGCSAYPAQLVRNRCMTVYTVTLNQLASHLWQAANILRGPVDAADFKTYVF